MVIDQFKKQVHNPSGQTLVMGILNVTPDSFSDGGEFDDTKKAVEHAISMISAGADVIDIGGESTRPGSKPVPVDDELARVIPVIELIRQESDICISIDTYKSAVANTALEAGADIVNDISGFMFDPQMVDTIRAAGVPAILMHIKGTPRDMQKNPSYNNLMMELVQYFEARIEYAVSSGLDRSQLILDPGIGFGKRLDDNFTILRNLNRIVELGQPVLIGPSRKAFIGNVLDLPPADRLEGTIAAVVAGIMNGARIVRVHDVGAVKRSVIICDRIRGAIAA